MSRFFVRYPLLLLFSLSLLLPQASPQTPPQERSSTPGEIQAPPWFPSILAPYREQPVAPATADNSARLETLIRDGKLYLSLSDALALALENNLDIAVQRYISPIAQTDVIRTLSGQATRGVTGALVPGGLTAGALGVGVSGTSGSGGLGSAGGITGGGGAISIGSSGNFDPTFSMNVSYDHVTSPLNTIQVSGIPVVTASATAMSGTYAQLFHSGTSYSLALTGQRQNSTQRNLRFNPAYVTRFSLGLHQPLLNGFGRPSNERFIRVARNNTEISEDVFRQQVISTIVQVESAYWELAALSENVRVATQSLEVAKRLLNDNRLRVEIGTMSPLEVTAAEAEVAARTRDLTLSETNLQLQEQTLKNLLSRRSSPTLDAATIALTDRLPEPKDADLPDIRVALESALKNRPDLRQAAGNLKNQEIANQFTKSSLMPALAVFGLYAGAGLQGDSAEGSTGAGDALLQSFQGDYPEYGGGMSLSLPIRNRVAQADNLRAQLEDRQLRLGFQRSQNQAALEVRKAIIGLIQGKAQAEAAHQAVRLAQEIWSGEQNRLEAGVSTSYQVILRERDFVAARQAEVSATVGYVKALVEMDRAMGVTLNRREILIEDALSGSLSRSPVPVSAATGSPRKSE